MALPEGFVMELSPTKGIELTWTPATALPIGGSRVEFRLMDKGILGYPLLKGDKYRVAISTRDKDLLSTDGQNLEVWLGSRLIQGGSDTNNVAGATTTTNADSSYDPQLNQKPTTPTIEINPDAFGNYATKVLAYDLTPLNITGFSAAVEVVAEVTWPLSANVNLPLVMFLHGGYTTCYAPQDDAYDDFHLGYRCLSGWPCKDPCIPIPSHQGYRYIADILASQGYIVISIAANGINGQDEGLSDAGASARSILIRHHLNLWAKWNNGSLTDPWGGLFKGKINMDKVVLVGHGRGGEGTNRAAIDATTSDLFNIVGLMSYGPTAIGHQVTPDIHSAIILPTCDGLLPDLPGQVYVDESRDVAYSEALRSAVIVVGANHYFFNSEWTPGQSLSADVDDWEYVDLGQSDPVCGNKGTSRLSASSQQKVGAVYTVAFVRLVVEQDSKMLVLFDGSFVRPASVGKKVDVVTSATGGAAFRLLYRPDDSGSPDLLNGMEGEECFGFYFALDYFTPVCGQGIYGATPNWQQMYGSTRPAAKALELRWSNSSSASARFAISINNGDLTSLDRIDVRVANDPDRIGAELTLLVLDNSGRNATLSSDLKVIEGWPGSGNLDRIHARTLRGNLGSVQNKVDLSHIVAVILETSSASGRVWVLDIAASQARIQRQAVLDLPMVSVESVSVMEGKGIGEAQIKIVSDKPFVAPGAIWVNFGFSKGFQIDIPTGTGSIIKTIPVKWMGDSTFSIEPIVNIGLVLATVKGAVTGSYLGGVSTIEDDPLPKLSVVANNVKGVKGGSLHWKLQLSSPVSSLSFSVKAIIPVGIELNSNDVDWCWLRHNGNGIPQILDPVTLSNMGLSLQVSFDYGVMEADVVVPLTDNGFVEGDKSIEFIVSKNLWSPVIVPSGGIILKGTVASRVVPMPVVVKKKKRLPKK